MNNEIKKPFAILKNKSVNSNKYPLFFLLTFPLKHVSFQASNQIKLWRLHQTYFPVLLLIIKYNCLKIYIYSRLLSLPLQERHQIFCQLQIPVRHLKSKCILHINT